VYRFLADIMSSARSEKSIFLLSPFLLIRAISRNGGLLENGRAIRSVPDRAPDLTIISGNNVHPNPLSII
jgi:hypothetical protein